MLCPVFRPHYISYIKDSIIVIIDCSKLNRRVAEDLFMNSRDRLANCTFKKSIEKYLEEILRNHQGLRDLKERRRREETRDKLSDSKPLKDTLKNILSNSPTLEKLFLQGKELSNPFKPGNARDKEEDFDGSRYPTYFRFRGKEDGESLKRNTPINRRCKIEFETDAENNYFERDIDRGKFELYLSGAVDKELKNYSINLHNGTATLFFTLPKNVSIGETLVIKSKVIDKVNFNGFINIINLTIIKAALTPPPHPPTNGSKLELPKMIKVKEKEEGFTLWENMTPSFNKFSALRIKQAGSSIDTEGKFIYDFYINVDNFYLLHELKISKDDPDIIEAKFIFSLVLLAMGILHQSIEKHSDCNNETYCVEEIIEEFSEGVASIIIPMINNLGELRIEDIEET